MDMFRRRRKLTPDEQQKLMTLFFEYKLASTPTGITKNGKRHDPEIVKREILAIDPFFFIKIEEREKAKKEREGQGIASDNSENSELRRRPLSSARVESRPLINSNDNEECDETKQTCCDKITGICKKLVGLGGKTRRKHNKKRKNKRKKTRGKRHTKKSRRS
jgi:hypothetical protein